MQHKCDLHRPQMTKLAFLSSRQYLIQIKKMYRKNFFLKSIKIKINSGIFSEHTHDCFNN